MSPSAEQLSVAVAEKFTTAQHSPVSLHTPRMSSGQVSSGGVVSSTVIVWVSELSLPQRSVAVQVRSSV